MTGGELGSPLDHPSYVATVVSGFKFLPCPSRWRKSLRARVAGGLPSSVLVPMAGFESGSPSLGPRALTRSHHGLGATSESADSDSEERRLRLTVGLQGRVK